MMIESDRELSAMVQEIWDNDVNRLKPGEDYRISLQGKAGDSMGGNDDNENNDNDSSERGGLPLFTFVNETIFKKETFSAFISLLDNYESDTGEPEIVTPEEVAENHRFLDAIVQTPTMKIAHKYLVEKQLSPQDETEFKEQLYRIWFELYARRGSSRPDSSGFEHVFVGETRGRRTVIGFHNWIQLYLQEKLGHIDYKGYSVTANSPQVQLLHLSIYVCTHCSLNPTGPPLFFFVLFYAARREQAHPGVTVQLEGRHKAQGQHLHRRQSRVRVRPVHSLFPHLAQRARQSAVQFLRRGDCLSPLQPKAHRHHIPCAT
uniref:Uridylate-specific endoribonuclease n=1 Tax=Fundulus heteroclitus TaxID=8078 RepID=A0A3Q2NWE8_FUNHE